jgi:hypothetical protein
MNAKAAALSLLGFSVVIACLLLAGSLGPLAATSAFAFALAVFGVLSGGFRNQGENKSSR